MNYTFWKRVPNLVFFSPSVRLSSLSGGMTSAVGANDTIAGGCSSGSPQGSRSFCNEGVSGELGYVVAEALNSRPTTWRSR